MADGFRQALTAAEAFAGATAPNPPVGCAVLDARGVVLACAAHQQAGGLHAEAAALAVCRETGLIDRVHTLIVTLEPCNHHGRTPPCVEAILASPVQAVWIGARDPNPAVAGEGGARLARAGLEVAFAGDLDHRDATGLSRQAARLIAPFVTWSVHGRPWLTVKQALTAEGGMAPPAGARTFTSQASLALAHQLRRRADAIVTGSGTILADAPLFTVRHVPDPRRAPRRLAVLDRRRRTPAAYLDAARRHGFEVSLHDDIPALLADLAASGVLEALVECGPTLLDAFRAADLWDEHVTIRQSPRPGEPDTVEILNRLAA
ncbi:riboflavin biosynthesis protein RibD [Caulobacter sp. AP07]|uniref:bifunctional diaminohydroxyphosphoribosylaminopyrimidine deaminase/5-amino-6-(5-phosphoribosylamino)uracil reductase RibD n=1 Tax=Caulobacter sp. AP07 TaxID=1144304 RepID=UPI000271F6F9|nr:bifunctional diaminohydroxyphosphoribosylaminopyrimidine deaminase/5-amino-6-(5-phosphoribosylamino)uracil reductase RibD [Caulobacter sp. AP07]EJL38250.1 riboflavin biosynthesis protein RibD [Caulobacter sp. AP07]